MNPQKVAFERLSEIEPIIERLVEENINLLFREFNMTNDEVNQFSSLKKEKIKSGLRKIVTCSLSDELILTNDATDFIPPYKEMLTVVARALIRLSRHLP